MRPQALECRGDCPISGTIVCHQRPAGPHHALRQAHHQIPAGTGRRPEPRARRRRRLHRAAAPARRAARAGGWRHRIAARARRRGRAEAAGRAQGIDRAVAQGRRHGRRDQRIARLEQPAQPGRQGSPEAQRPVHRLRDVPARRHRRQGRPRAAAQGRGTVAQGAGGRDRARARRRRRRLAGSRRPARGARQIHDRPHRACARRQARPGDRPRRRNPPHDPDPAAAHQEQPGADRRAGRGQDGDRRGPRAAHRRRRSAGDAQEQARAVARHGGAARRRQVPRRVRGAPEVGAQGHRRRRGPHDRLHRRAAHDGRRRQGRGRDRRRQHAQARARARRAALHRRDDARRVPQVHREGRGARAPLPEGAGRRAVGGVDDRHPARPAGALRDPPRRRHHRPGDRCRRRAVAPLHHRPLPAGQGDRPHRRGGGAHQDGDRLQAGGDGQARPAPDPAQDRARGGEEGEGRRFEEAPGDDRGRDRAPRARVRRPRRGVEGREGRCRRHAAHQGGDRQDQGRDGGGAAPRRLAEDVRAPVRQAAAARGAVEEGRQGPGRRAEEGAQAAAHAGRRRGDRRSRVACDRHPGVEDDAGRARQAARDGGQAAPARGRPGRGGAPRRPTRSAARAPDCPIPTGPTAPSCSSARRASARPSSPRRSPSSCSTPTRR